MYKMYQASITTEEISSYDAQLYAVVKQIT